MGEIESCLMNIIGIRACTVVQRLIVQRLAAPLKIAEARQGGDLEQNFVEQSFIGQGFK